MPTTKFILRQVENTREYGFMGLRERKAVLKTEVIDLALYNKVYAGEIEAGDSELATLDKIFQIFNMHHPEDYKSRSLSVGDIVDLNGKFWYCDMFGWRDVTAVCANVLQAIQD